LFGRLALSETCFLLAVLIGGSSRLCLTTSPIAAKSALRGEVRRNTSPDRAAGLRIFQPQEFLSFVAQLNVGRDLRNQRGAVTVGDHLHHGRKAVGAERRARGVAGAVSRGWVTAQASAARPKWLCHRHRIN
jgi:hypothetical protein